MQRPSGRSPVQLRDVTITRNFTRHAEGSVLVAFGDTKVSGGLGGLRVMEDSDFELCRHPQH